MNRRMMMIGVCLLMALCGSGYAEAAYSVAWDAVTQDVNGNPETLQGYRLWFCAGNGHTSSTCHPSLPLCPTAVVPTPSGCVVRFPVPVTGTLYTPTDQTESRSWFVTAVDVAGHESTASNLAYFPIPVPDVAPQSPTNMRVIIP
jgi:hypothetical protein